MAFQRFDEDDIQEEKQKNDGKTFFCDLCGTKMEGRHCKLICPNCHYIRDCSDP